MPSLDRGLAIVEKLDVLEKSFGNAESVTLARQWKRLDSTIRERAKSWSTDVIAEMSRMTRSEQLQCVAEFDSGEFRSIEGAVLGEESLEHEANDTEVVLSPAMKATLQASYRCIDELRALVGAVDDFYKREAIGYQLFRTEKALEAWSKTPKEMLNVQG